MSEKPGKAQGWTPRIVSNEPEPEISKPRRRVRKSDKTIPLECPKCSSQDLIPTYRPRAKSDGSVVQGKVTGYNCPFCKIIVHQV